MAIRGSDDACYLGRGLKRAVECDCEARLFDLGWGFKLIAENRLIAFHSAGDFLWANLRVVKIGSRKFLSLLFDDERYVQGPVAVPRPVNSAFPRPRDVSGGATSDTGRQR